MNPKLETQDPEEIWEEGIWVASGNSKIVIPTLEELFYFINENPKYKKRGFYCLSISKRDYDHAILCANCRILFCIYPFMNLAKHRDNNACCSEKCNLEFMI